MLLDMPQGVKQRRELVVAIEVGGPIDVERDRQRAVDVNRQSACDGLIAVRLERG